MAEEPLTAEEVGFVTSTLVDPLCRVHLAEVSNHTLSAELQRRLDTLIAELPTRHEAPRIVVVVSDVPADHLADDGSGRYVVVEGTSTHAVVRYLRDRNLSSSTIQRNRPDSFVHGHRTPLNHDLVVLRGFD